VSRRQGRSCNLGAARGVVNAYKAPEPSETLRQGRTTRSTRPRSSARKPIRSNRRKTQDWCAFQSPRPQFPRVRSPIRKAPPFTPHTERLIHGARVVSRRCWWPDIRPRALRIGRTRATCPIHPDRRRAATRLPSGRDRGQGTGGVLPPGHLGQPLGHWGHHVFNNSGPCKNVGLRPPVRLPIRLTVPTGYPSEQNLAL
jgi:hypothetical protein